MSVTGDHCARAITDTEANCQQKKHSQQLAHLLRSLRVLGYHCHYARTWALRGRAAPNSSSHPGRPLSRLRWGRFALAQTRLRAGLSQAELAARMGTSQSTIAQLESGQTLPSMKTLLRYAEATGSKFHVRLSAA
jgi:DNA-binding XRE family transcriptional regulator